LRRQFDSDVSGSIKFSKKYSCSGNYFAYQQLFNCGKKWREDGSQNIVKNLSVASFPQIGSDRRLLYIWDIFGKVKFIAKEFDFRVAVLVSSPI